MSVVFASHDVRHAQMTPSPHPALFGRRFSSTSEAALFHSRRLANTLQPICENVRVTCGILCSDVRDDRGPTSAQLSKANATHFGSSSSLSSPTFRNHCSSFLANTQHVWQKGCSGNTKATRSHDVAQLLFFWGGVISQNHRLHKHPLSSFPRISSPLPFFWAFLGSLCFPQANVLFLCWGPCLQPRKRGKIGRPMK